MKFEAIIEELGEFGPYQKRVYFLVCLVAIPHAIQLLGIVFTMGSQNHRCAIPGLANDTYHVQGDWHKDVIDTWIPMDTDTDDYSSCRILVRDPTSQHMTNQTEACSHYVYDTDVFDTTITSDLGLVCDRKSLTTYANMIFMGGMLAGSLVMGTLSDVIGRKKTLVIAILFEWISSLVLAFVNNYVPFVIVRFFSAFFGIALFMTAFVIGVEIVGPETRKFVGIIIELIYTGGLFINAMLAYFIREWTTLQIITAVPTILLMCYVFLIPESVRWLIRKGRYEQASKIIEKAAKVNQVTLSDSVRNLKSIESDDEQAKLWQMFSTKVLLKRSLVLVYIWYVISLVYFGLSLNVGSLSGDIHLNFVLFTVVEALAYVTCLVLLDRTGRRPLMSFSLLLSGVACLGIMFPVMYGGDDISWLTQTFSLGGKFGASMAFGIIFVYTAEVFPTTLRNSGIGICSFSGRIGGIMSPYIADLGKIVTGRMGVALPLIIFGAAAILAGLLTLLLPETTNQVLPESIQDAKEFGRNSPLRIKEVSLLDRHELKSTEKPADSDLDTDRQDKAKYSTGDWHSVEAKSPMI